MLLCDVHSELKLSRSSHRCSAEERALQQILLVEDVIDVKLGTNKGPSESKRKSGASVQNETWLHLDALVEIEESGAVGTIAAGGIDGRAA